MTIMSTPGPDSITDGIYKEYAYLFIYPVYKIWQASLKSGKLPEGTGQVIITPIYVSGVKNNPANYHILAVTNHLTKIFDRILKKSITSTWILT